MLPFKISVSCRTRLREVVYLGNVRRGMGELEADPLAMQAGRKPPDHRHLMRHVGVVHWDRE